MTTRFILAAAALSAGASLHASTLSTATAVQSKPDPASAVIVVLPAGSEQPATSDKAGVPPSGWIAVDVAGPFEAYVKNKDLTKQLDIIPGSSVYLSPKDGGGVLTVFEKGDKAEITGLHGGWTQVRLDKTLVGFIQSNPTALAASAPALAPLAPAASPTPPPFSAIPVAPASAADSGNVRLSRLFEGTLASTKSILMLKRPFDWQILDPSGKRIAYVDLSKLLVTDQIENYAGHGVVLLGSLQPIKDSDDLVIEVVGLRLK